MTLVAKDIASMTKLGPVVTAHGQNREGPSIEMVTGRKGKA